MWLRQEDYVIWSEKLVTLLSQYGLIGRFVGGQLVFWFVGGSLVGRFVGGQLVDFDVGGGLVGILFVGGHLLDVGWFDGCWLISMGWCSYKTDIAKNL